MAEPIAAAVAAIAQAKADRRRALRGLRRSLSTAIREAETLAANGHLWHALEQAGHPPFAAYVAVGGELDLGACIERTWSAGRPVWLPKVIAPGRLAWHPVRAWDQLTSGYGGIREPSAVATLATALPPTALIAVPGVGFTANGGRLGQGGGFYDRVLADHRGWCIGIGFTCQLADALPSEAHDAQLARVILGDRLFITPAATPPGMA